jgi:uncharacterized membrane protein YebE (DUF533 family)
MAFNANDLLGALLQSDPNGVADQRLGRAIGAAGGQQPAAGGLGGLLQSVLGGAGGSAGGGGGGLMEMASSILGGGKAQGGGLAEAAGGFLQQAQELMKKNPQLAAGGLGAIAGALLGGGGKSVRGAMGGAAMGVLGLIAMNAIKAMRQPAGAQSSAASAEPTAAEVEAALPKDQAAQESRAMTLLAAMIAAAKADGHIDDAEMQKIVQKLQEAGIDEEGRQWVVGELAKPLDLDALTAGIRDPATAAQVYAASLLAITVDTPAEQDYLRQLAQKLGLPPAAVTSIHQTMGVQVNAAL